jgi:putative FmdB family regulatory protein
MPLYNYECRRHGSFLEWRSMSICDKPAPCPECGKLAPRGPSTPRLGMDAAMRNAHAVNEKSAHEPRVVRRRRGDSIPQHDAHRDLTQARGSRHGHSHSHSHAHRPGKLERSNHPWMIRH